MLIENQALRGSCEGTFTPRDSSPFLQREAPWHGGCSSRRRTGGLSMRRIVLTAIPLLAFAAGGDFFGTKKSFYTYCDATGCYTCDENGCVPRGSDPNDGCSSDQQCQAGCYCDPNTHNCTEAGYCNQNSDCASGYTCDTTRN